VDLTSSLCVFVFFQAPRDVLTLQLSTKLSILSYATHRDDTSHSSIQYVHISNLKRLKMQMFKHCTTALLLILITTSNAQSNEVDGNFIINTCGNNSLNDNAKSIADSFCTGFVFGLRGAFEMSFDVYKIPANNRFYCAPYDVTLQQSVDVFLKYLKENPSIRNNTGRVLFVKAMNEAFPCKK
jgi:hypothetical protein